MHKNSDKNLNLLRTGNSLELKNVNDNFTHDTLKFQLLKNKRYSLSQVHLHGEV